MFRSRRCYEILWNDKTAYGRLAFTQFDMTESFHIIWLVKTTYAYATHLKQSNMEEK